MAGLFAQVGVSPWVLVRVVRRWPDFIFATGNKTYSFVESKAFTQNTSGDDGLRGRVLNEHLSEGAADTVQQLNSDPLGRVWYAFTHVVSITPMMLDVTFVELSSVREHRNHTTTMPQAVVDGLAERAINQAAAMLDPEDLDDLGRPPKNRLWNVPGKIKGLAAEQLGDLLKDAGSEVGDDEDNLAVHRAIEKILSRLQKKRWTRPGAEEAVGRRFMEAKQQAIEGRLSKLRRVADKWLLMADLPPDQQSDVRGRWNINWERASSPWGVVDGIELWRCGGAVLCYGPEDLHGKSLDGAAIVR